MGRLSVEKGVDVLIDAAALLVERGVDFRLRIVGGGQEEQHLRSLVARLNLDLLVEFLGPVSRLQLGALYRSADVVCVPSRSDPLPTVVLEAMAAGVAVVGTEVGGIPFMIENGITGLICPIANPVALADTLVQFAFETELAQRMGEAGQQRVVREFNWSRVAELLCAAIRPVSNNLISR